MEPWEFQFFTDRYMMKVFESVLDSPKSAEQISDECHIPRSTVYRKLRDLEEKHLLQRKGTIENGKRTRIYKKKNQRLRDVNEK